MMKFETLSARAPARAGRSLRSFRRVAAVMVVLVAAACAPAPNGGTGLPKVTGTPLPAVPADLAMHTEVVASGLDLPTNVEFAADGRVFVSEKSGVIRTWDNVSDTTATVTADLRQLTRSIGDQGLLGMAVDPGWPTRPYLYTLSSFDSTGQWGDNCPTPYPAPGVDGCVSGGQINRLTLDTDGRMVGVPTPLVSDRWCMQFPSHHVGDLTFLPDGTLLATAGEGAAWWDTDFGQKGGTGGTPPNYTPANPCADPPGGAGARSVPTTGEGGAFRAQDLLTPGDPTGWNGAMVRIDPNTGKAPADNPLVGRGTADDDEIVAHGFRNPFRMTVRPGTSDVYVADVGWTAFEEIDRTSPKDSTIDNFGWPCREGPVDQPGYQNLRSTMCTRIKDPAAVSKLTDPWFSYFHDGTGQSISGVAFVPAGRYSADLTGSLLFADYVDGTVWSSPVQADGSRQNVPPTPVIADLTAVDLEAGPDGYIYAPDIATGSLVRLVQGPSGPVARVTANRVDGPLPLAVTFDASTSTNPGTGTLSYDWDLNGDGTFGDATGPVVSRTYTSGVNVDVAVRVRRADASSQASVRIFPGNTPPAANLQVNAPALWSVGDPISFTIAGTDAQDGALPKANLSWAVDLHHCADATSCHVHPDFSAVASSGFAFVAPQHEAPSFMVVRGTVRDARGEVTTVEQRLDPATVRLYVTSFPVTGASFSVGGDTSLTPKGVELIRGSTVVISTPYKQQQGVLPLTFNAWSDGKPRVHEVTVTENTTLTASFGVG